MRIKLLLSAIIFLFVSNLSYSYDSTRVSFSEAMDALDAEEYEKAVELFTSYIRIATGHDEGYYQRGNAYYELKQYDKALTDYSTAYNMGYQKNEVMFFRMGTILKENKNYLTALDYFNKAVSIDKKYIEAYLELGNLYLLNEDYKNAKENYEKALTIDPNYPEVNFALGEIEMRSGNYGDAAVFYEKAIKLDTTSNLKYYYQLGMAYNSLKDSVNTIKNLNKALQINPGYGLANYGLAMVYNENGNYTKAIEQLTKAIDSKGSGLMPNLLYTERGITYLKLNDVDNAYKDFDFAIKINPNDTDSYLERGKILYHMGKDSLAFSDFAKVISIDEQKGEAYAYRGIIYMQRQQPEFAEPDLKKAILFNPEDTVALFNLGNVYYSMDDFQNALNYYIKALKVNPKYSEVFENRGICYYNLGFYKLAAADFEAAMRYNPKLTEKLQPLYQDAKLR